jgi:hypothetical protein
MNENSTTVRQIKLKNRRVIVGNVHGKGLVIRFVKLDEHPTEVTIESNRNVHTTTLTLTYEAGLALRQLLGEMIRLSDVDVKVIE